jgi:MEDS: MEthanogen/methylotroph, DcmR Sensory domain
MDHFVHLYQEVDALADAVAEYAGSGLRRGEAVVLIATPEHCTAFLERLDVREDSLHVLDAERTLARFMENGMPQWERFHEVVGGPIAELRLQYPAVRAYGEMVDVLCSNRCARSTRTLFPRAMRRFRRGDARSELQGPRPAARADPAITREESSTGHAHAGRASGAPLAEAEHAAHGGKSS